MNTLMDTTLSLAGPLNSLAQELHKTQGDNVSCLPSILKVNWVDWIECLSRKVCWVPGHSPFQNFFVTHHSSSWTCFCTYTVILLKHNTPDVPRKLTLLVLGKITLAAMLYRNHEEQPTIPRTENLVLHITRHSLIYYI